MRPTLRHLLPGIGLIIAVSAVMLLVDYTMRKANEKTGPVGQNPAYTHDHPARIAVLQPASNAVMDDCVKGLIAGLASRGFKEGDNLEIKGCNAEGDQTTFNLLAKQMISGPYDLNVSFATTSLQILAAANRDSHRPHLFGGVTSPVAAGVGIQQLDSLDKPPYMTGYGTAQPVEAIFREAVAANPKLKTVGVVWNAAEVNSEVCTKRARAICQELGLTLLEATITNANEVHDAAESLVTRGAEAFWTGGDLLMITAYDILQQVADKARIPIFSNVSGHAAKGALFDFGANYFQVGYAVGQLAGDVLLGQRVIAQTPVTDLMPGRVGLNEKTRAALRDTWTFNPSQYERAGYVVEADGKVREIKPPATAPGTKSGPDTRSAVLPASGKLPWRLQSIIYIETAPCEETMQGLREGLRDSGLVANRDFVLVRERSAQGDMTSMGAVFDAAATEGTDLYLSLSTPALQTAVRKVTKQPVVFTFVTDPMAAGAADSFEKHRPNFTGISTLAPAEDMMEVLTTYFPNWKRIGTLYCPAEINSVVNMKHLTDVAAQYGITVETVAADTSADVQNAARSLASKNIDALVQISDNLSAAGFIAIAQAAKGRHLPVFAFQSPLTSQGAALAMSMDYHQAGVDAAALAARVMRGDNPGDIPISLPSKKVLYLNLSNAKDAGITFPPALLNRADKVLP